MDVRFDILVFAVALVPVALFLWGVNNLRRGLKMAETRGRALRNALLLMPFIFVLAPFFMFVMMCAENAIDPDFAARSFVNPSAAGQEAFFFFALDQTAKGALFDAAEAFNLDFSRLEHKCDSRLFCGSIFIYRTTVASVVSVIVLALVILAGRLRDRLRGVLRSNDAASD